MALTVEQYLRPDVIQQVQRLDLKARFIVEGFLSGLHDSPYHGFSVEFSEHRKYSSGDDTRQIDWNVFAKTDRFYIKQYEEETNLQGWILLDISESMDYKSGAVSKLEYGSYIAALKDRAYLAFIVFASLCFSSLSWGGFAVVLYMRDALRLSPEHILYYMAAGSFAVTLTIRFWGRYADHAGGPHGMALSLFAASCMSLAYVFVLPDMPNRYVALAAIVIPGSVFGSAFWATSSVESNVSSGLTSCAFSRAAASSRANGSFCGFGSG